MKLLALLFVLAAFPAFLALLSSPSGKKWAFIALGALPLVYASLNLDGSILSWPFWQGYSKGLIITIIDPLALAICLRCGRGHASPPLVWAFVIYLICLLPGLLFVGNFTPGSFFFFQALRITLFFYAIYLAALSGQLLRIAEGLAIAVIASGLFSGYQALTGAGQAPGLLGHQNSTGLATNLCIPVLLSLGMRTKRRLFFAAVMAGAIGAVAGGSRATIVFFAFAVSLTIFATVLMKPSSRTWMTAGLCALGLLAAAPFAIQKLNERGDFEVDAERLAFEKTAELIIEDYPWGVGLNQYIGVANAGGYFDQAGVRWGREARSTSVHNVYLLIRAEAGLLGLIGLLTWLCGSLLFAALAMFRTTVALREVSVACGISLLGVALHSQYEWVLLTAAPQYIVAMVMGVAAAIAADSKRSKGIRNRRPAVAASDDRVSPPIVAPNKSRF